MPSWDEWTKIAACFIVCFLNTESQFCFLRHLCFPVIYKILPDFFTTFTFSFSTFFSPNGFALVFFLLLSYKRWWSIFLVFSVFLAVSISTSLFFLFPNHCCMSFLFWFLLVYSAVYCPCLTYIHAPAHPAPHTWPAQAMETFIRVPRDRWSGQKTKDKQHTC